MPFAEWILLPCATGLFIIILAVPGILFQALMNRRVFGSKGDSGSVLFFIYSIVFFLIIYLVFDVLFFRVCNVRLPDFLFLGAYISALGALIWFLGGWRKTQTYVWNFISENRGALAAYAGAVLLATVFACSYNLRPLTELSYQSISFHRTFHTWNSHDNYFQYVNGLAIGRYETFEKYYSNGRLVYAPQDREMLPGVLWSVLVRVLSTRSYFLYTVFGICINSYVILMLHLIARDWFGVRRTPLVLWAMLLSPSVLIHLYFTWFKFAGAAFFLAGIYLLLNHLLRRRGWLACGLCLGLGYNMHGGVALAYPVAIGFFAFFVFRTRGFARALAQSSILMAGFAALFVPWYLVKKYLFGTTANVLVQQHFLYDKWSVADFFQAVPWSVQWPQRLHHLWQSLRFETIANFLNDSWREGTLEYFFRNWNSLEVLYIACSLYPFALWGVMSRVSQADGVSPPKADSNAAEKWGRPLVLISLSSILIVIFMKYSVKWDPDFSIESPMACILILQIACLAAASKGNSRFITSFKIYLLISAVRLSAEFWAPIFSN